MLNAIIAAFTSLLAIGDTPLLATFSGLSGQVEDRSPFVHCSYSDDIEDHDRLVVQKIPLNVETEKVVVGIVLKRKVVHFDEDFREIRADVLRRFPMVKKYNDFHYYYANEKLDVSLVFYSGSLMAEDPPPKYRYRRSDGRPWHSKVGLSITDLQAGREVCRVDFSSDEGEFYFSPNAHSVGESFLNAKVIFGRESIVKTKTPINLLRRCLALMRGHLYGLKILLPADDPRNFFAPAPDTVKLDEQAIYIMRLGDTEEDLIREKALGICRDANDLDRSENEREKMYLKSRELDRTVNCPKVYLSVLYEREGRLQEAIDVARELLETAPEKHGLRNKALKRLSHLYEKDGRFREALEVENELLANTHDKYGILRDKVLKRIQHLKALSGEE